MIGMTRKTLTATLLLAGAALGAAGSAGAGWAAGDDDRVLELVGKRTSMHPEMKPGMMPGAGDSMVSTIDFTDKKSGKPFGTVSVTCTITAMPEGKGPEAICHGTLAGDKGALYLGGLNPMYGDFPRKHTIAVLGGTGKYSDARGEAEVVNPDMMSSQLTIRLAR